MRESERDFIGQTHPHLQVRKCGQLRHLKPRRDRWWLCSERLLPELDILQVGRGGEAQGLGLGGEDGKEGEWEVGWGNAADLPLISSKQDDSSVHT